MSMTRKFIVWVNAFKAHPYQKMFLQLLAVYRGRSASELQRQMVDKLIDETTDEELGKILALKAGDPVSVEEFRSMRAEAERVVTTEIRPLEVVEAAEG